MRCLPVCLDLAPSHRRVFQQVDCSHGHRSALAATQPEGFLGQRGEAACVQVRHSAGASLPLGLSYRRHEALSSV